MAVQIGQDIGSYHIIEELGQGGMATVYKAYDTLLQRQVALKFIRVDVIGPDYLKEMLKRFEREARALAKFLHPGIVSVYDYGEYEGAPYLVMAYLPGGTLKALTGKPMPYAEAARLLAPVARALEYAHEQNIIHRDVKPGNILLTEKGEPMLSDFGIAKILGGEDTTSLTGTGVGVGTPEYMAPEQWEGKAVPQTDIYALGVVFYELVTGHKPYTADTPAAVLIKQITGRLPRPRQFVPDLPEEVEQVLFKALAKEAGDRYATMRDFAGVLERLGNLTSLPAPLPVGEGSQAPFPASGGRIGDGGQPSRILLWVGIAVVVLCLLGMAGAGIAGLGFGLWKAQPTRVAQSVIQTLSENTPVPGTTPRSTPNPAQTGNATQEPAVQSTATPSLITLAGTPVHLPSKAISLQTAGRVVQLARWGRGTLNQILYSPDGKSLAMASSTGVYLYDAVTLQEQRFMESDTGVTGITFSPDGKTIASASESSFSGGGNYSEAGGVKLWRVSDGSLLTTIEDLSGARCVAFSPDGATLASGTDGGTVKLWRASDGTPLITLEGHTGNVISIAFAPDGKTLASVSYDNTVRLWKVSDGSPFFTLEDPDAANYDSFFGIAFSPDGKTLVTGGTRDGMRLWQVLDGKLLSTLSDTSGAADVAFSPDGATLVSGALDGAVKLWKVSDGSLLSTLQGYLHSGEIRGVAFSPDGKTIASGFQDGTVKQWQVSDGRLLSTFQGHTERVSRVAFSPDGKLLASVSLTSDVKLWQVSDGSLFSTLKDPNPDTNVQILDAVFSPDGTLLASGSNYGTVSLWRASDGKLLSTLQAGGIDGIAFSPDGKTLASGSGDNTVKLWQVSDGKLLFTLKGHTDRVNSVAFSPDGTTLASISYDNTVKLWRVSDGSLLATLQSEEHGGYDVAFSPDGAILASGGSSDGTACLWRISDGKLLSTLQMGYSGSVSVVFSLDGSILFTGSPDNTVKLWRVSNGSLLFTLQGHTLGVTSIALSPDGTLLASGSEDGTIRLWGAP